LPLPLSLELDQPSSSPTKQEDDEKNSGRGNWTPETWRSTRLRSTARDNDRPHIAPGFDVAPGKLDVRSMSERTNHITEAWH
jgi:hypothetical protein